MIRQKSDEKVVLACNQVLLFLPVREGLEISLSENSPPFPSGPGEKKRLVYPFNPESDQCQISPAASPEISHHTVWRTYLFIAYSDERWWYYQFSLLYLTHFLNVGRMYFLSLGVKWLRNVPLSSTCRADQSFLWSSALWTIPCWKRKNRGKRVHLNERHHTRPLIPFKAPIPRGSTPIYGLYGDVPLNRVWFCLSESGTGSTNQRFLSGTGYNFCHSESGTRSGWLFCCQNRDTNERCCYSRSGPAARSLKHAVSD